jgi:hypothetical protein
MKTSRWLKGLAFAVLAFAVPTYAQATKVSTPASTTLTLSASESISITAPATGTLTYNGTTVTTTAPLSVVVSWNLVPANYNSGVYLATYFASGGLPGGIGNYSASFNGGSSAQCNSSAAAGGNMTVGTTTQWGIPVANNNVCGGGFQIISSANLVSQAVSSATTSVTITGSPAYVPAGNYSAVLTFIAGAF